MILRTIRREAADTVHGRDQVRAHGRNDTDVDADDDEPVRPATVATHQDRRHRREAARDRDADEAGRAGVEAAARVDVAIAAIINTIVGEGVRAVVVLGGTIEVARPAARDRGLGRLVRGPGPGPGREKIAM